MQRPQFGMCVRWPARRIARASSWLRIRRQACVARLLRITLCREGCPVSQAMRLPTFSLRGGMTPSDRTSTSGFAFTANPQDTLIPPVVSVLSRHDQHHDRCLVDAALAWRWPGQLQRRRQQPDILRLWRREDQSRQRLINLKAFGPRPQDRPRPRRIPRARFRPASPAATLSRPNRLDSNTL